MKNCKANAKILILVSQFILIIGIVITLYAFFSDDGNHPLTVRDSKIAGPCLIGLALLMLGLGCGSRKRFGMKEEKAEVRIEAGDAVSYGGTGEKESGDQPQDIHVSGKKRGGWERFP